MSPARVAAGVRRVLACFCPGSTRFNDVRDRRRGPPSPPQAVPARRRRRLRPRQALAIGGSLMSARLGLVRGRAAAARGSWARVPVVLTLSYTLLWRHVAVLDLFAIAAGFVLRAVAGGVAAPVTLSRWFLVRDHVRRLCSSPPASAGPSSSGRTRTSDGSAERAGRRRVLELYTHGGLALLMAGAAACALFAYCVWAFQLPTAGGIPWRPVLDPSRSRSGCCATSCSWSAATARRRRRCCSPTV